MKKLYDQVSAQIKKVNEQYKAKRNKNETRLALKLVNFIWLPKEGKVSLKNKEQAYG